MNDEKKMYMRLVTVFGVICILIALGDQQAERSIYVLWWMSSILIYLGSLTYLMGYLRRVHTGIWVDLGQPSMSVDFARNASFRSGFLILGYVFSNRCKKLEDSRLNAVIWLVRVFFALSLVFFLVFFLGPFLLGSNTGAGG